MYTFSTTREGFSMMSSPVAPPFDRRLDPALYRLSVAHFIVAEGAAFEPFAQALDALDVSQVEYGRLQFLHTLNQIRDTLDHNRKETSSLHENLHHAPLTTTVQAMLNMVVRDVDAIAKDCDQRPRKQDRLAQWPQALAVLAQAQVTVQALHDTELDHDWSAVLDTTTAALKHAVATYTAFRNGVGTHYAHVVALLPETDVHRLIEDARKAVAHAIQTPIDLSYSTLMHLSDMAGNRDQLWSLVQNDEKRQAAIAAHEYQELSPQKSQELKIGMAAVLRSFDASRASNFVNALRAIAQEQAYGGAASLNYIESYQDASELREGHRRAVANPYTSLKDRPTDADLEKQLSLLPTKRAAQTLDATARMAYAARIDDAVRHVAQGLALPFVQPLSVLTLTTLDDGITIGRLNNDSTRVLLVYPDSTVHREGAVYVVVAPSSAIAEGIPAFSPALRDRQQDGWKGTNFRSIGDFMSEMQTAHYQNMMLGQPFAVMLSNPSRPKGHVYPAPHRGRFG